MTPQFRHTKFNTPLNWCLFLHACHCFSCRFRFVTQCQLSLAVLSPEGSDLGQAVGCPGQKWNCCEFCSFLPDAKTQTKNCKIPCERLRQSFVHISLQMRRVTGIYHGYGHWLGAMICRTGHFPPQKFCASHRPASFQVCLNAKSPMGAFS